MLICLLLFSILTSFGASIEFDNSPEKYNSFYNPFNTHLTQASSGYAPSPYQPLPSSSSYRASEDHSTSTYPSNSYGSIGSSLVSSVSPYTSGIKYPAPPSIPQIPTITPSPQASSSAYTSNSLNNYADTSSTSNNYNSLLNYQSSRLTFNPAQIPALTLPKLPSLNQANFYSNDNHYAKPQQFNHQPQAPSSLPNYTPLQQSYRQPLPQSQAHAQSSLSYNQPAYTHPVVSTPTQKPIQYTPAVIHYVDVDPSLQGNYKFGYHTGGPGSKDNSFREETRLSDGSVKGAYGYIDANGQQHIVRYTAGKNGFVVETDDPPASTGSNTLATANTFNTPQTQPQTAPYKPAILSSDDYPALNSFLSRI